MNKIVFLYQQEKEVGEFFSLSMLKHALQTKGIQVEEKNINAAGSIRNSVVFMVKFANPALGEILKNNNNYIILDLVDIMAHLPSGRQNDYVNNVIVDGKVDKLLVRQKWVYDTFGDEYSSYIPFHYDYRIDEITPSLVDTTTTKISFPYGDPSDMVMHKHFPDLFNIVEMDGKDCYDFERITKIHLDATKNYFYFSAKVPNSLSYLFKPCTKTATAAAMSRNIITSYDECLRDLLPEDYPYLFDSDNPQHFLEFYKTKIETPNKEEYRYGLECMQKVREKTNLFNQVPLYQRLFDR